MPLFNIVIRRRDSDFYETCVEATTVNQAYREVERLAYFPLEEMSELTIREYEPWKLVYSETGEPVQIGDTATTLRGETVTIESLAAPHKPSSTGKVHTSDGSFYPSVIRAHWTGGPWCRSVLDR